MILCHACNGSGEMRNPYPDCYIDGMETVIDHPEFVECSFCNGTGETGADETLDV